MTTRLAARLHSGTMEGVTPLEQFEEQRPRLFGIAYRMLGSVAEAEDVVQDAWLRWNGAGSPLHCVPKIVLFEV